MRHSPSDSINRQRTFKIVLCFEGLDYEVVNLVASSKKKALDLAKAQAKKKFPKRDILVCKTMEDWNAYVDSLPPAD